jgi:hypothetical protein
MMLITLQVKPYTVKFLTRHVGHNYQLRLDDPFGNYLFTQLRKNSKSKRAEGFMSRYTCTFPVSVCPDKLRKKGARAITSLTIINFNNFVELIFKHEFHTFVETWTEENGLTIAEAIRRFCQRYNLSEEDISEDTLRRSYLRYWNGKYRPQVA